MFGAAIHASIETHCRGLLEGRRPDLDALLEWYQLRWTEEAGGEIRYGRNQTAKDLHSLAARMLTAFQASELSKFDSGNVIGIEEELRGTVCDVLPELLGRVDLLVHEDDSLTIADFKTARSAWQSGQIWEASQQALLYTLLAGPIASAIDSKVRFRWIILTKTKTPSVTSIDFAPDDRQMLRAVRVVEQVWKAIEAGHFHPAPSAMNCSSCPYQTACRDWSCDEE